MSRGQLKFPEVNFIGCLLIQLSNFSVVLPSHANWQIGSINIGSGRISCQNPAEMFSREEILRSAVFAAIGGIIAVVVLKLLEKNEITPHREIQIRPGMRGENDLNEADKRPQEHDERFC